MDQELEKMVDECEASWPTTKELAFAIDDPLEKLMEKAKKIFNGRHWSTLDALAIRIADACPRGVTEKNFEAAEPVAGACKKYFSNIEKLRMGLNRPFLDAKKAVDQAAKATVDRAEPTLLPIINAVKKIQDRKKKEEEARAEVDRKRIEDERLAAEKAHRDMIEAEQNAERARIAAAAEANRMEADRLAAEKKNIADDAAALAAHNKAVNDEMAELKRQIAELSMPPTDLLKQKFPLSGEKCVVVVEKSANWPPTLLPSFDDDAPPLPPLDLTLLDSFDSAVDPKSSSKMTAAELQACMLDAETSAELSKAGVEVDASFDQQKVNDFGDTIAEFKDTLKRPLLVKVAAKQAVDLAVFDLCEIAKRLREWRGA